MEKFLYKSHKLENQMKIAWIIIILSPIVIGIIVSVNVVDIPTNNDWIGFFAAIIGGTLSGLLTFFSIYLSMSGVRKQIEAQITSNDLLEKQMKAEHIRNIENKKLEVRPFINEYNGNPSESITYFAHFFESNNFDDRYEDEITLHLKNIGLGPMIGFHIVSIDGEMPISNEIKSVEKNGVLSIYFTYSFNEAYLMKTYTIKVEFEDILSNKYSQLFEMECHREDKVDSDKVIKSRISKVYMPELLENCDKNSI